MTGLTTPVAGSFLALVLCAVAVADWGTVSATGVGRDRGGRARHGQHGGPATSFSGPGYFPFPYGDLVAVLAVCALLASPLLATPRPVRAAALLYAVASVALFVVPNSDGRQRRSPWALTSGSP